MNNKIEIFNHEQFGDISVRMVNNEFYFLGSDITKSLGYKNSRKALKDHCKRVVQLEVPHPQSKTKMLLMNFISEPDLYRLVANSKLPSAEKFEEWIFEEVLPSIRKHGAYMTESTIDKLINNPDLVIGLATKLKEEQEQRKKAENTIKLQTPKVKYFDKVLDAKGSKTTTQVAKLLGLRSAIQLNNILHELGIQYKQSGQWLLYSQYADKGYTETSTHLYKGVDGYEYASKSTKWTEKGIHFIYEQLGKHGLLEAI